MFAGNWFICKNDDSLIGNWLSPRIENGDCLVALLFAVVNSGLLFYPYTVSFSKVVIYFKMFLGRNKKCNKIEINIKKINK